MLRKILLGMASMVAVAATPALADPIKVESENIVFYADSSPSFAKKLVRKMEIYRKLIMTLGGIEPVADEQKLTIYAFDTVGDLSRFTGLKGAAGVYTNGYDGPLMVTPMRGALRQDNFNNQVALHEYSHHVLHGYTTTAYPRWYDEGFANYLSTFILEDDGTIQLGRAAAKHARGLMRGGPRWVDIEDVVSAIRVYPFADKGNKRGILLNQFYAQSWLYVHYLHSDKELSKRFGNYLERVNSGEEPLAAFENGFGITTKEFHKKARRYFEDNKFKVQQFKPAPSFMNIPMKATKISDAELELQMALGQRAFLSKSTANNYAKKINAYEKENGQTLQSLAARASYFITKEEYDQAQTYALSALGNDPQSVEALRIAGDVYFHKSHEEAFKDLEDSDPRFFTLNEDMKAAINYFDKALRRSPDDYASVTHMVSVYGASDIPVTSAAAAAASTYSGLYWTPNDVSGSLDLASIYMKQGKKTDACEFFDTAKKQTETSEEKEKSPLYNRVKVMMDDFGPACNLTLAE